LGKFLEGDLAAEDPGKNLGKGENKRIVIKQKGTIGGNRLPDSGNLSGGQVSGNRMHPLVQDGIDFRSELHKNRLIARRQDPGEAFHPVIVPWERRQWRPS
jgi:hypothetical protein